MKELWSAAARFVYDVGYMGNGALCGLAAITAGCSTVNPWAAIIIGGVAGTGYVVSSKVMVLLHMDDPLDAISVHAFGGTWGVFAVGEPPPLSSSVPPRLLSLMTSSVVTNAAVYSLAGGVLPISTQDDADNHCTCCSVHLVINGAAMLDPAANVSGLAGLHLSLVVLNIQSGTLSPGRTLCFATCHAWLMSLTQQT